MNINNYLRLILFIFIVAGLVFDGTVFSVPVAVGLCMLLFVSNPDAISLIFIFIISTFIDMLRLQTVGATAIFLLISFGFIYLYRNTFELKDVKLIAFLPFLAAYIYSILFNYNTSLF